MNFRDALTKLRMDKDSLLRKQTKLFCEDLRMVAQRDRYDETQASAIVIAAMEELSSGRPKDDNIAQRRLDDLLYDNPQLAEEMDDVRSLQTLIKQLWKAFNPTLCADAPSLEAAEAGANQWLMEKGYFFDASSQEELADAVSAEIDRISAAVSPNVPRAQRGR